MMKKSRFFAIAIASMLTLSACEQSDDLNEAKKVSDLITKDAENLSNFPKTLNIQNLHEMYAPGAVVINDGEEVDFNEFNKVFEKMKEEIRLGTQIFISARNSNIKIQFLSKNSAFAQYDSIVKMRNPKENFSWDSTPAKCTALFKKEDQKWLITNENCSSKHGPEATAKATEPAKAVEAVEANDQEPS